MREPPLRFVQARHFTPGRPGPIELIVIHTMESPEQPGTAERVAAWFAGASAPPASAHYCLDADTVVATVRDSDVAWHAPGANDRSLGLEHAGRAAQSARDWGDPYSSRMLALSAGLVARKCAQYDIPVAWLGAAALRAGRRGITGHDEVARAFRLSDHTDPGPAFPVEAYLSLVRAGARSRSRAHV